MKQTLLMTFAMCAALIGFSTTAAVAQKYETISENKTGKTHFGKAVRVGDQTLEAGMYQVQHVDENGEHIIVFRAIEMFNSRNSMPTGKPGEEVARVKCTVEDVAKKVGGTKVLIRKNAAGEREVFEVWIRGEKFKHIVPTS